MRDFLKRLFGARTQAGLSETKDEMVLPADSDTMGSPSAADLNAVVVSDLGNVRRNNEDTGLFVRLADEGLRRFKGYLLLVADGMGGHLAGEVASQMAAEIVSREYFQHRDTTEKCLMRAFQMANRQIFEESRTHETFRGMGTTCTAVVVQDQQLFFAHVGDSRAYLFKNGQIVQLTEDHTYVQELLRMGEITEQAAITHPERNVLTHAMGTKADIRIDLGRCVLPFDPGDRLLLCSDGLYEYCRDEDLVRILGQVSLPEAAEELVRTAKSRGGHDNITVVVAERTLTGNDTPPSETREIELPFTRDIELP
ncbi:Stp1/IreP family PP2C-type Ser/Thr phosphatase [Larkinella soli]|uniref:Stp1/IreP family PP2C-type Ser/Thr phosphatase n=1 Tax=Larkinella soli TaxID=1770527 RepID=UPI000FFC97B7|nr:Stp1/IreP family PP2C-type Ser/Thr phosphatase [Larkinella soli]